MTRSPRADTLPHVPIQDHAVLEIDLGAIAENYHALTAQLTDSVLAAVVKANAYGLGIDAIVPVLNHVGCKTFFVAHAREGAQIRELAPKADIYVLNGLIADASAFYVDYGLIPCLIDTVQIHAWSNWCRQNGTQKAALYLDTGFNRVGLTLADFIDGAPSDLANFDLTLIMSHLACADDPNHKMNRAQLEMFHTIRALLPSAPASLANSGGVMLGTDYHFDMVRCGIALYGGIERTQPNTATNTLTLKPVITLRAHILAIREIVAGETIGYGADFTAFSHMTIAIISAGYADGIPRNGGHGTPPFATCYIAEHPVPIIGRISMDSFAIDISNLPTHPKIGDCVELIGKNAPITKMATQYGTIAHNLLTQLGNRCQTIYNNTS